MNNFVQGRAVRIVGATAVAGVAFSGIAVAGAASASASVKDPVVVQAPKKVQAGDLFKLSCKIKPKKTAKIWKGATAVVHEKGVPIHASRVVGKNGACSMNLVLTDTGKHKLRVVVLGAQNDLRSKLVTIRVQ